MGDAGQRMESRRAGRADGQGRPDQAGRMRGQNKKVFSCLPSTANLRFGRSAMSDPAKSIMKRIPITTILLAGCVVLGLSCKQEEYAPSGSGGGTIRIGEVASLTGKEAAFGNSSHKGTLLAIDELNAAGGVLGRKLELIAEDNRSTPGESATVVQKLISRDKVVAILGEVASGRSLEAAPICQKHRIPQVSPS